MSQPPNKLPEPTGNADVVQSVTSVTVPFQFAGGSAWVASPLCIMRYIHLLLLSLLVAGCATQTASSRYDPIAKYLMPQLIDRHLMNGSRSTPSPAIRTEGGQLVIEFSGHCSVTIGKGSSFFTEDDYKELRGGLFGTILGEGLSPKIGRRAFIAGIKDDIILFTTTDGKFDIRIDPHGTPQPVDVVGIAKELSELYDKQSNKLLQTKRDGRFNSASWITLVDPACLSSER